MRILDETVRKRLDALDTVTKRLEDDLRQTLGQTAPTINIGSQRRADRLSFDGQLWYAYAKLNAALEELEVSQTRAMPPHEREARFKSARLKRRLTGQEEQEALDQLNLQARPGRRVYEMRRPSKEVKLRAGDFDFALAPEQEAGFLDRSYLRVTEGTTLEPEDASVRHIKMAVVTQVTVAAIDRERLLIAVDPNSRFPTMLDELEVHGLAALTRNVVLDPIHQDTFTRKLLAALQAIGNPPTARDNPLVRRATGMTDGRGARRTAHSPPADILWDALSMSNIGITRNLLPVRTQLVGQGYDLNPTQWIAWEQALSQRLQLIWGPPGTGKSRTARSIVLGAALDAYLRRQPLRILISASTYTAIDNVLLDVYTGVQRLFPPSACNVHRLRSYRKAADPNVPREIDVEVNRFRPSQRATNLIASLNNADGITIVGATPEQIYNLMTVADNPAQREFFDLILMDEASQTDVAHAILTFCSLASNGSIVLAGDPKQLPPIHQAEPPTGLESLVGSVYSFCRDFHGVSEVMLDLNYRSNATIVEFARSVGYQNTLTSYSSDMRLNLITPLPVMQPVSWPPALHWTPEWSALLDPNQSTVCFTYSDGQSSQWNAFEADAVTTMITLLAGRMGNQLLHERDRHGDIRPTSDQAYTTEEFWQKAVGVVTPHRAQQGLIVSRLQTVFGDVPSSLIRDAVDTVERFQGQERDVIIASFALGDPDAIQSEDAFLMSLNRFNVMASRPRAKLIVLISQQIVDHLSNDLDTLRESRLLKLYVDAFCRNSRPMNLGHLTNGQVRNVTGLFKWR